MRRFWKNLNILYERILLIIFLLVLLIVAYCLYDTWYVFDHAADDSYLKYKPTASNAEEAGDSPITEDMAAWLTIDDTGIDYPVMQADNNSKYLNLDPYGQFSLSGSIFLDFRNASDFSDEYSLVYGHHMEYGKMFGALDDFLDQSYLEEHTSGTLLVGRTGEAEYPLRVFASMEANARDNMIFSPNEEEGIEEYIKTNAEYYIDCPELQGKRILGLSTCADGDSLTRILVFCYILDNNSKGEGNL
ncbi:MAG: class B sortase [Eubacteriales bacterium]|nr:class B sortase [Eubacteriales bacterium]